MELTITRALAELKLLKARVTKEVNDMNIVAVSHGTKLRSPYSSIKKEDFISQAKERYQSVMDLYERINAIKCAIDKSNSVTTITVCNEEMTIQEALNKKNLIEYKMMILKKLKAQALSATEDFDKALRENDLQVERLISGIDAASDKNKAAAKEEAEKYIEKSKEVAMVDPCNINKMIKDLEEYIEDFNSNIDYALSESNSTTKIEI
jgi:hypothetical protein